VNGREGRAEEGRRGASLRPAETLSGSAFDQAHFTRARTFAGFFRRELYALSFAQELEHCSANRAAVKEVLNPAFVPDEAEALVDQEASDRPGWHTRVLRWAYRRDYPGGWQVESSEEGREDAARDSRNADDLPNLPAPRARAEFLPHAELENGAKFRQFVRRSQEILGIYGIPKQV